MPPSSANNSTARVEISSGVAEGRPSLRIWYAILAAPIAWVIEEYLGWLLSSGSCPSGSPSGVGGTAVIGDARAVLIGVAIAAFLVSLSALWIGILEFRGSGDRGITCILSRRRSDYLAAIAVLVSFIFTLAVLLESVVVFVLPSCEVMR